MMFYRVMRRAKKLLDTPLLLEPTVGRRRAAWWWRVRGAWDRFWFERKRRRARR
jgi:hypothetical protein